MGTAYPEFVGYVVGGCETGMVDGTGPIGVLGTGAAVVGLILVVVVLEVIHEEIPPKENPPELGAGAAGPDGAGRPMPWLGACGPGGNGG